MKIEHIGIATHKIDDALAFWRDALGLRVVETEEVAEQGVRVAMLLLGEPRVELLEPTSEASPVAKFLAKRGAGIHHIAVRVDDIRATAEQLRRSGVRMRDVGAGDEPLRLGPNLNYWTLAESSGGVGYQLIQRVED